MGISQVSAHTKEVNRLDLHLIVLPVNFIDIGCSIYNTNLPVKWPPSMPIGSLDGNDLMD